MPSYDYSQGMHVGIVGATGQVGSVMRGILIEREFPIDSIRFFASERSAGKKIGFQGDDIVVENATTANWDGLDIVLFSAGGGLSKELAPTVASAGAIVIDNSSAWRMDDDVPLVVPEVNSHALEEIPKGIVANPNCTTMVAMPVLKPLHTEAGLEKLIISTYQATSGAGLSGVEELANQINEAGSSAIDLTHNGSAVAFSNGNSFTEPIAFNVIPFCGALIDDELEETNEERKLRDESRKILEIPDLAVSATCVRVPVYTGHSLAVSASFSSPISASKVRTILKEIPSVILDDVPTPLKSAGVDPTYVGRIRPDTVLANGISLFLSGDNLRKGAALNAVQIAEALNS
jgi:aspartate-semialdehyde dehydrogenase